MATKTLTPSAGGAVLAPPAEPRAADTHPGLAEAVERATERARRKPGPLQKRYELLEMAGQGAMASVYRARDTSLDREVAVKVLHPHLLNNNEARARFVSEARAVARLKHPNIIEIFDFSGDTGGDCYIVTEFIDGGNLRSFLERHPLTVPETGAMFAAVLAGALAQAHTLGIIHRDIKPENILIGRGGALKITDFGIARLAGQTALTMTGALIGSPGYMAPEQVEGQDIDARADIFALGVVTYLLVTARMPFDARTSHGLIKQVMMGEFPRPENITAAVDPALGEIICRAMAMNPAERFPTAEEFRDNLLAWLQGSGIADPDAELAAFFQDPEGYQKALKERLVPHLVAAAELARRNGDHAHALDAVNRVLALEPDNEAAAGVMRRVTRRSRITRTAHRAAVVAGATLVALAAGVWAAGHWANQEAVVTASRDADWLRAQLPDDSAAAPEKPSAPGIEPAGDPGPASELADAPAKAPAKPEMKTNSIKTAMMVKPTDDNPPTSSTLPRPLTIRLNTWANLFVDDAPVGGPSAVHHIELAPGTHSIRLANPHFIAFEQMNFVVAPGSGALEDMAVHLKPGPARLSINNPQNAEVIVDNVPKGSAAESVKYPIIVEMPEKSLERTAMIRLVKDGYSPLEWEVSLRAGEQKTVTLNLSKMGSAAP